MLQKQLAHIEFRGGLEKKDDTRLIVHGKLTQLDDAVFDAGTISKRDGYAAITTTLLSGSALSGPKRLAQRGDELLIEATSGLYSLARGHTDGLIQRTSQFLRAELELKDIARSTLDQYEFDVAMSGSGMSCWVWVETDTSTVRQGYCAVRDDDTGAFYAYRLSLDSSCYVPRVVWSATAGKFFIYYQQGTNFFGENVKVRVVDPAAPATLGAATTLFTSAQGKPLDAYVDSTTGRVVLAFVSLNNAGTTTGIRVVKLDTNGTTVLANNDIIASSSGCEHLSVNIPSDNEVYRVIWQSSASVLKASTYDSTFVTYLEQTITSAATNLGRITAVLNGSNCEVFYEQGVNSALDTKRFVGKARLNNSVGVLSATDVMLRSVGIAARPFVYSSGIYLPVVFYSKLQPTVYVVDTSGTLDTAVAIARLMPEQAGDYRSLNASRVPHSLVSGTRAYVAVARRGQLRIVEGADETPSGVSLASLDFNKPLQRVEFGGLTLFAGACPLVFDGSSVFEQGFHYYPDDEFFTAADGGAGGGMTGGATYQYVCVYEWVDTQGRLWQSVPSIAKSVTLASSSGQATVTVPTLRLTRRSGVKIILYRTEGNGTTFYRVKPLTGNKEIDNSLSADTVAVTDDTSDANLVGGELLYTTGGILESGPVPACTVLATHQNRLVMAGLENPYEVRYSEALLDSIAPSMNAAYSVFVAPKHGRVTGLASVDDKLVVLTEDGVAVVFGQGPDRLGQQNGFSEPQFVVMGTGCKRDAAESLAVTNGGLWFRSEAGLRFLTRGMQLAQRQDGKYVGAEVDELLDGCVASMVMPVKPEVRFWTGTVVLVHNHQHDQWSRFTNHACVDALVLTRKPVHLTSGGVLYETSSSYVTDAGAGINMVIETGWLKFGGIQGFQRVWRLLLLGGFTDSSSLLVQVGHDYETAYNAGVSVTTSNVGSSTTPLQLRHHLEKQKCEAMRVKLTESGATGRGFSLSGMTLEVGIKKGGRKLAATRTV